MIKHDHISDRMLHGAENRAVARHDQKSPSLARNREKGAKIGFAKPREGRFCSPDDQQNGNNEPRGAKP